MEHSRELMLLVVALFTAVLAVAALLKQRQARTWPATEGIVVETGPTSLLQGSASVGSLNLDSDHFLEWTVDGKRRRRRILRLVPRRRSQ